jgi:hypothetical protein
MEQKVKGEDEYDKAHRRQLRLLEAGLDMGTNGQIKYSRDELHTGR